MPPPSQITSADPVAFKNFARMIIGIPGGRSPPSVRAARWMAPVIPVERVVNAPLRLLMRCRVVTGNVIGEIAISMSVTQLLQIALKIPSGWRSCRQPLRYRMGNTAPSRTDRGIYLECQLAASGPVLLHNRQNTQLPGRD